MFSYALVLHDTYCIKLHNTHNAHYAIYMNSNVYQQLTETAVR